ncbi:MAG TPA: pseudomurein-binding repeat-containing protein, partial [Methanobacterium sp.]|nr:pseudomurein-binding repeat-containing protein [Methanobacterium sp.]
MLFLVLSLPLNLDAVTAATNTSNTTKVTVSQLTTANSNVNTYYKTNKKLPNYVTISGKQITMPQFLYLLACGTSELSSGSTASITIKNVSIPTKPVETLSKGNIQKSEYVTLSKTLKKYIESYGRLPNYLSTSRGKMKFETTLDMYSKIILFYKTNKRLPSYVSVAPWSGKNYTQDEGTSLIEITVTPSQLNYAAQNLKTFIETNNQMPTSVSLAGQKITIAQFLQLLAQRILNINSNLNYNLTTQKVYMATTPTENLKTGNIQKSEFLNLAGNLTSFTSTNNRIPNYLNTTLGKMRYESVVYLFLKVVNFYNTNNRLPSYVSISPWTGTTTSGPGSGIM